VGKEVIQGVPTTHYHGTLPTATEVFGVKTHYSASDLDVWIDGQDRVRRMQAVITGGAGEEGIETTTEMTIDYVEFGRVPAIAPPPAGEVFDGTSKLESQVQSAAESH
jgi:hypothetical protein